MRSGKTVRSRQPSNADTLLHGGGERRERVRWRERWWMEETSSDVGEPRVLGGRRDSGRVRLRGRLM